MEKKIGILKQKIAKTLYKEGDTLVVPFKSGKKLTIELPLEISNYLKLKKTKKLYAAIVGNTIQIVGHKILSTIPVETENTEDYLNQVE